MSSFGGLFKAKFALHAFKGIYLLTARRKGTTLLFGLIGSLSVCCIPVLGMDFKPGGQPKFTLDSLDEVHFDIFFMQFVAWLQLQRLGFIVKALYQYQLFLSVGRAVYDRSRDSDQLRRDKIKSPFRIFLDAALASGGGESGSYTPNSDHEAVVQALMTECKKKITFAQQATPSRGEAHLELILDGLEKFNQDVFAYLSIVGAQCPEALTIIQRHLDESDGLACLLDLKQAALGVSGLDSAESLLSRLYNTSTDMDFREMVNLVYTLSSRILALPDLSISALLKFFLLRCVRNHSDYLHYQAEEKECADNASLSLKQCHMKFVTTYGRLHGNGDPEVAHFANKRGGGTYCIDCGKPGAKRGDGLGVLAPCS